MHGRLAPAEPAREDVAFGVKHGEIHDQNRCFEMFYDALNGFTVLAGKIES